MASFLSTILKQKHNTPPSFKLAASKKDEPAIPDPAVFTISPLTVSALTPLSPPTVSQCAVHLELLQALSKLKHRVVKEAAFIEVFGTVGEERELWWSAFVEVAVGRFGTWWWGVEEELVRREKGLKALSTRSGSPGARSVLDGKAGGSVLDRKAGGSVLDGKAGGSVLDRKAGGSVLDGKAGGSVKSGVTGEEKKAWSVKSGVVQGGVKIKELPEDLLPPLDVLMVWHSYMLNPRCYNEDALHFGLIHILNIAFPWAHVHAAINTETFDYTVPGPATSFFEKLSGQSANLMEELLWKEIAPEKSIKCPKCGNDNPPVRICDSEKKGGGWMDIDFSVDCKGCGVAIDKKALCAEKFRTDVDEFLKAGSEGRMRMISLDRQGYTYLEDPNSSNWEAEDFVNDLFRKTFPTTPSIDEDLASLEARLYANINKETEKKSNLDALNSCLEALRATPRKFSLNLNSAVIRQGGFVEKMNHELWIRSPGLIGHLPTESLSTVRNQLGSSRCCVIVENDSGFLKRAIKRYEGFFSLFKAHPRNILSPTLDVDLVWHTHLLTPIYYRVWCRGEAGRFIDHNDKLGSSTLEDAFEFTNEAYWEAFKKPYSKCCCWFCEAAISEGLDPQDERNEDGLWGKMLKRGHKGGKKEKAVRVRVEYYRDAEKRRRDALGGLEWEGLFEALKRC